MANTVRILKLSDGWYLYILGVGTEPIHTLIQYNTLYAALEGANLLMVHIDNLEELPLHQYKQAA